MASRKKQRVESAVPTVWKPAKKGDTLEGKYLGAELMPAKGGREPFTTYHIEDEKGERFCVASAMLTNKMRQIPRDTFIWLTYTGIFKTEKGNTNDFTVDIEDGVELIDILSDASAIEQQPRAN